MTNSVNLEDVARAMAAADPDLDADGQRIFVQTFRLLSGETIRLAVTPERVKEVRPEGAVVSFLRPDGPLGPDVLEPFCHFVHFFTSRESAECWMAVHPGTFLLSVDDAFELGRLTNHLRVPEILGWGGVVR